MNTLNPKVDQFLALGCGRCPLGGTPQCKVHDWTEELKRLRRLVLGSGLTEELKWGVPCYTSGKANVAIIGALKECCSLSFLKGALLPDPAGILEKPGANSQAARLVRFRAVQEIVDLEPTLHEYLRHAIEIERAGLKVDFKAKTELVIPPELEKAFRELPPLRSAFEALTLGRQRGYILHFTAPKQSKTRESRIAKCTPQILEGRGLHD